MRVWVAPWIDDEGDLHQQGYLYMVVDQGQWAIGLPSVQSSGDPVRRELNIKQTEKRSGPDEE
jgi:conjugal transfer pilus assembly protein TraV